MEQQKHWSSVLSEAGGRSYAQWVREKDQTLGSFLEFDPARGLMTAQTQKKTEVSDSEPLLKNIPFAIKDNIALKNFKLTCGSKMLSTFVSPYTATAVERLITQGAVPVGKTNLDEFGMGSSTDNSALMNTNNPWNSEFVAGGSSGGSASSVAAGLVPLALGSDTGGSVRQPANFCGVYGLKPTYGAVSRYGLVAYASSLEVIGITSLDIDLLEQCFRTMRGVDPRDQTSLVWDDSHVRETKTAGRTIGMLVGDLGLDPGVAEAYGNSRKALEQLGYTVEEISLPMLEYAVPAYYTIATAEASANLARFNGIRYGHRPIFAENPEELIRKSRDEGFGDEVKLRILLGTYVLRSGFQDQFYHRAQKIRTAIRMDFERIFSKVDAIIMPVYPTQAFKHGEGGLDPFQQKVADKFTTAANLTGMPALAIPTGVHQGLPTGIQCMGPYFGEERLMDVARRLSELLPVQYSPHTPHPYTMAGSGGAV
ncbi:Asp-tRNA(Asn)/Glu-tRNA(Gln) amidotransferase subunit GatA [Spirochaeta lutea]|uniref:Asp-tRNA(Asn)/Glu-tRNA(Gln) amidotransferase subunit GatA n=1 Tax=Spirochaeta lutea TaxID=1480694 RepID=UPI00068CCCA3|nr:Asp-tRNA(Asn)/Glu-tRNA(Gln) amidotransferase subunit GatA [Spirochaeta lutea]